MSKIFIVGATGGVGSRLGPMLVKAGHIVTALHRKPEQASHLADAGMTPCLGDITKMTADDFTNFTKNSDVIVFSAGAAGSGLERTSAYSWEKVSSKQFMQPRQMESLAFILFQHSWTRFATTPRKEGFEHYMRVKRKADNVLVASGLEWVILRPGTLVSEDGDGLVNANLAIPYGSVARGNVAAMLAALIEIPAFRREIIELTDGDVPVQDAAMTLRR